jgi:hypothetical protein
MAKKAQKIKKVGNEKSHPAKSATFKHATGEIAFTYKSK